jgi:hypothetical protein
VFHVRSDAVASAQNSGSLTAKIVYVEPLARVRVVTVELYVTSQGRLRVESSSGGSPELAGMCSELTSELPSGAHRRRRRWHRRTYVYESPSPLQRESVRVGRSGSRASKASYYAIGAVNAADRIQRKGRANPAHV